MVERLAHPPKRVATVALTAVEGGKETLHHATFSDHALKTPLAAVFRWRRRGARDAQAKQGGSSIEKKQTGGQHRAPCPGPKGPKGSAEAETL